MSGYHERVTATQEAVVIQTAVLVEAAKELRRDHLHEVAREIEACVRILDSEQDVYDRVKHVLLPLKDIAEKLGNMGSRYQPVVRGLEGARRVLLERASRILSDTQEIDEEDIPKK